MKPFPELAQGTFFSKPYFNFDIFIMCEKVTKTAICDYLYMLPSLIQKKETKSR